MPMPFLADVANHIASKYHPEAPWTLIFPQQRSIICFQNYWHQDHPTKPLPFCKTLHTFITQQTNIKISPYINLWHQLYDCFDKYPSLKKNIEEWLYWSKIIIQDFNWMDEYNLTIDQWIADSHIMDTSWFSDTQKQALTFWLQHSTRQYQARIKKILPVVYNDFQKKMIQTQEGYPGFAYRQFYQQLLFKKKENNNIPIAFIGFNALSPIERNIFLWFQKHQKAVFFWDVDPYYINDSLQEAGFFLRQNIAEMPNQLPMIKHLQKKPPAIEIYSAASTIAPIEWVKKKILKLLNENIKPDHIAIVLIDKNLRKNIFYAFEDLQKKISCQFSLYEPIQQTFLYQLLYQTWHLQIHWSKKNKICLQTVKNILKNPYIRYHTQCTYDECFSSLQQANTEGKPIVFTENILSHIFQKSTDILLYIVHILKILQQTRTHTTHKNLQWEYSTIPYWISDIQQLTQQTKNIAYKTEQLFQIWQQYVKTRALPLQTSSATKKILQIMGILETHNLDFDYVFLLGMNEKDYPQEIYLPSFFTNEQKQQFMLPTKKQRDAEYAYYFYRCLQKAKKVWITYVQQAGGKKGDMSRYLKQLAYETQWVKTIGTMDTPMIATKIKPIIAYRQPHESIQQLTPTAIHTYLDCSLKFYFQYVKRLREKKNIHDQSEAMLLGQYLHQVLAEVYRRKPIPRMVVSEEIQHLLQTLDSVIQKIYTCDFHKASSKSMPIIQAMVKKMASKILMHDLAAAPFQLLAVEKKIEILWPIHQEGGKKITLQGIVDRIHTKAQRIWIVDYKTGHVQGQIPSIDSLFDATLPKRHATAFQLFFYAWLYQKKKQPTLPIVPYMVQKPSIGPLAWHQYFFFQKIEKHHTKKIEDIQTFLPTWEKHLNHTIQSIFNDKNPFIQTVHQQKCTHCPYKKICQRH